MVTAVNENEQIVLDLFSSMSAKAFDQAVGLLHEEITWTLMLVGMQGAGAHTGKDAVLKNVIAGAPGSFGRVIRKSWWTGSSPPAIS